MTNKTKRQMIEETNQFLRDRSWDFRVSSLSGAIRVKRTLSFKLWALRKAWDELMVVIINAFKNLKK